MKNGTEKYIETVAYLGKLYDFANAELFGGELVKPVITVQTDERNKTNGWWSLGKVWKENGEDDGEHELNMTAQQLNRPIHPLAAPFAQMRLKGKQKVDPFVLPRLLQKPAYLHERRYIRHVHLRLRLRLVFALFGAAAKQRAGQRLYLFH